MTFVAYRYKKISRIFNSVNPLSYLIMAINVMISDDHGNGDCID